jgi:hypothetical protein
MGELSPFFELRGITLGDARRAGILARWREVQVMRATAAAAFTELRSQELQTYQLRFTLTKHAVLLWWRTADGQGLPEAALLNILGYAMPSYLEVELPHNLRRAFRGSTTNPLRYAYIFIVCEQEDLPRMQKIYTGWAAKQPPLRVRLLKSGKRLLRCARVSEHFLTHLSWEARGLDLAERRRLIEMDDEADEGAEPDDPESAGEREESNEADEEDHESGHLERYFIYPVEDDE